jgi:hypothetical protein
MHWASISNNETTGLSEKLSPFAPGQAALTLCDATACSDSCTSKLGRESVKLVPREDRRHFIDDYNNIESALKRDKVVQ